MTFNAIISDYFEVKSDVFSIKMLYSKVWLTLLQKFLPKSFTIIEKCPLFAMIFLKK